MSNSSAVDIGLGQLILKRAELTPGHRAITFEGHTRTFSKLAERVQRIASVLKQGGVCRGDRVGYIGLNHPVFLELLYACGCLGAIFVPLNFRLTGPEACFIVNDAGIHTLLADDALRPLIDQTRSDLCCRRYLSIESADQQWQSLEPLLQVAIPVMGSERVAADDVALIMYTSGTTGLPKGAMLTHGNIFWNSVNTAFGEDSMSGTTLTCAPLFHIGGLNVTTLLSLARGIEVILHRSFDPGLVLADIQRYNVCTMFGAPTMYLMMAQHDTFNTTDLTSIDTVIVGGAPVPVPLIETYGERGVTFCQAYGLTETAPFASILSADLAISKIGSAGCPPLFTDVRIVDANNQPLPHGERGEVCIKGPNVMKGYWNRAEATAEAVDSMGWFHSGDIGYFDDDGFLFLCDRLKDMIITGGENVYPAEIESVLYAHSAIVEVAVIGVPDEKWGEALAAVVVLAPESHLDLQQLRDFAEQKLARYKLPSQLHEVEVLPRNPAGKVQKFIIKEQLMQA